MDFGLWLGAAHRRAPRSPDASRPHSGDERRELSACNQQEGSATVRSEPERKLKNDRRRSHRDQKLKRRRAHCAALRYATRAAMCAEEKQTRASRPFSLNPTGTLSRRVPAQFACAIDTDRIALVTHDVSPIS